MDDHTILISMIILAEAVRGPVPLKSFIRVQSFLLSVQYPPKCVGGDVCVSLSPHYIEEIWQGTD